MLGNGGLSMGSRAASCAFMDRLDPLTSAVYPHELPRLSCQSGKEPPPRFPLNSFTAVLPVLIGMGNLTIHVFRPYVVAGLFVLAGFGVSSIYCVATAACLLAYLFLFDDRFLRSERLSPLPPGLHCRRSPRTDAIVSMVSALRHPYYTGTPWIIGGDLATLYPFLAFGLFNFTLPGVDYTRRWLTVDEDDTRKTGGNVGKAKGKNGAGGGRSLGSSDSLGGFADYGGTTHAAGAPSTEGGGDAGEKEAVALDVALPEEGLDPAKPFYLVLHGLTGGSAEPYVLDFVRHALGRGCGVCVMISRGCMGTPVRGYSLFHGARISDAGSTVQALRRSLPEQTPIAMVGYSMGGIVAMNYVALSGANSGVSCCVSMAGSLDTRTNMGARHSQRVWQPILARALKEHFVVNNESKILERGLDMSAIERCKNVLDMDTHLVAPYNGYPDVKSYYNDMSAAADGKIKGLRTPTLAVSSLDDPIMTGGGWPSASLKETKDLFILLTRKGGHVGWPTGWSPTRNRWSWMSTTSLDFCEAILATAAL